MPVFETNALSKHYPSVRALDELNVSIEPGIVAADAAFLLIGLVQGLAVRWSLAGRTFDLVDEGARLFDLQLSLLTRYPAAASPA